MAELKKKITLTVTNDLTYDQRMQKIGRSLCAAGFEVELVGRIRNYSKPLTEEPFKQTRLRCFIHKGKLFYIEYNLRLLIYLLFCKTEAICAVDLDTIVPVFIAGWLKRVKLIYDAHEYFTEVPEVIHRKRVQQVWQWVEKTFVPKFHLAYTVSPAIARLFSDKYHTPFHVIMNVPVWKEKAIGENSHSNYILYQGALNEGRGIEHLLKAMQQIDARLLLAGEGDLSQHLRELAIQLKVEDKVEFLGYVKPDELRTITARATIGINLLENRGLSYYYSLSNKFFDYIHAQVPQICIDFPEYRELNRKFGVALLAKDCSVSEIKMLVERLMTDKSLYADLQKKCEVCARTLNWQQEEQKLTALYHELLR
ncbi:MAG: glycosyltransferase [Chitinophagales bacterium]